MGTLVLVIYLVVVLTLIGLTYPSDDEADDRAQFDPLYVKPLTTYEVYDCESEFDGD